METPKGPWDQWVPGALNRCQVEELYDRHLVTTTGDNLRIKPCSIDLTLSDEVYLMEYSVKPTSAGHYQDEIQHGNKVSSEPDGTFLLKPGNTYVIRLREELSRDLGRIGVHGQATAKSSIGRLDVLARLIVNFMDSYECFDAKALKDGDGSAKMYLEVTPITFSVKVKPGDSLSQLRLFYGEPKRSEVTGNEICRTVIRPANEIKGQVLRLNLDPVFVGGIEICAYRARRTCQAPILTSSPAGSLNPSECWERMPRDPTNGIRIEKEQFYILRSLERLWVPNGIAIYCEASDETLGEMRIHYAGFVHPGFGQASPDEAGAPLIFEVRGHQLTALLKHREKMANLIFYRMSKPDHDETPYDKQELTLSKIFADWPE